MIHSELTTRDICRCGMQGINLQSSNIYHDVIDWKIIQNVALGFGAKGEEADQRHYQTHRHGDTRRIVRNKSETVQGRSL